MKNIYKNNEHLNLLAVAMENTWFALKKFDSRLVLTDCLLWRQNGIITVEMSTSMAYAII